MRKHLLSALLAVCLVATAFAQQGKVYETRTVKSKILGMERSYSIYLPVGYEEGDGSYPDADTVHKGYFNLLDGTYNYEDFFFKELIPHIEKTYRVRAESRYRAISGLSMGGGGALFYALHYPEMFVAAAPLSAVGGEWTFDQMKNQSDLSKVSEEKKAEILGQMDIQTILEKSPKEKLDRIKWIRWYISCGDDDFLSITNCLLHNTLLQHQVGHEFRVKDGGHSWTYWRMELPEVMRFVSRIFTQY